MTRPLRSARITRPQRYYETVRPRAPRRYSAPCGGGRLGISLSPLARQAGDSIGATGSHVPCKSPGQARATYMPDAIWAVSRLPPDLSRSPGPAPVSTPLRKLTTRQQRFASARLPDPHLTRSSPRLFRSAHHERHLTDAARGGLRPPPAGRPRRTCLHLLHSTASGGFYIEPSFSVRGTRPGVLRLQVIFFVSVLSPWLLRGCSRARTQQSGACQKRPVRRPMRGHSPRSRAVSSGRCPPRAH